MNHTAIHKHVNQVPPVRRYTFKKRKTSGIYQLDYEFKTVEIAADLMTAWATVGYDHQLHSIEKEL